MPVVMEQEGALTITHEVQKKHYWTGPREGRVKVPFHQVKVSFSARGYNGVALVALDGWNRSEWEMKNPPDQRQWARDTSGMNVRLSLNGGLSLTWPEWKQLNDYIERVYYRLMDGAEDGI